MKKLLTLVLLLCGLYTYCQNIPIESTITSAKVFKSNAVVWRTGSITLPPGQSTIEFTGITQYMEPKSIQVDGKGAFTIIGVEHKKNVIHKVFNKDSINSTLQSIDSLRTEIEILNARKQTVDYMIKRIQQNTILKNKEEPDAEDLINLVQYYNEQLSSSKYELIHIENEKNRIQKEIGRLTEVLSKLRAPEYQIDYTVFISLSLDQEESIEITLQYLVSQAGWYPKYDLRIDSLDQPITCMYKAEVFQNTGVDWNDIQLSFSNADPKRSNVVPELEKWEINYKRYTRFNTKKPSSFFKARSSNTIYGVVYDADGLELIGANIIVKGTTIGTITDIDGNYEITVPPGDQTLVCSYAGFETQEQKLNNNQVNFAMQEGQLLEEVVITRNLNARAYSISTVSGTAKKKPIRYVNSKVFNKETSFEISIEKPYSIKSKSGAIKVTMLELSLPASYKHIAVPKITETAYLIAEVANWEQYNLLQGEANLYLDGQFQGRTILNPIAFTDTLTLSVGRDPSVIIKRDINKRYREKKLLGSNYHLNRRIDITVRNTKPHAINLIIEDQIPVSVNDDIKIDFENETVSSYDKNLGSITWDLNISAHETKELNFEYKVKHPKKEIVILE